MFQKLKPGKEEVLCLEIRKIFMSKIFVCVCQTQVLAFRDKSYKASPLRFDVKKSKVT